MKTMPASVHGKVSGKDTSVPGQPLDKKKATAKSPLSDFFSILQGAVLPTLPVNVPVSQRPVHNHKSAASAVQQTGRQTDAAKQGPEAAILRTATGGRTHNDALVPHANDTKPSFGRVVNALESKDVGGRRMPAADDGKAAPVVGESTSAQTSTATHASNVATHVPVHGQAPNVAAHVPLQGQAAQLGATMVQVRGVMPSVTQVGQTSATPPTNTLRVGHIAAPQLLSTVVPTPAGSAHKVPPAVAYSEPDVKVSAAAFVLQDEARTMKSASTSSKATDDTATDVASAAAPDRSKKVADSGQQGANGLLPWTQPHAPVSSLDPRPTGPPQTAPPSAPVPPTISLHDAGASKQLGDMVVRQMEVGPNQLHVKVNPEGMGNIVVSVTKQADGVHVRIEASQMQTTQWLTQQTDVLAQAIRSSGVDVGNVQVSFGQASLSGGANSDQPSKRQRNPLGDAGTGRVSAARDVGASRFSLEDALTRGQGISIQV